VPGPELDDLEHAAWRAFLRTHATVARRLEADLIASSDLPLAEFDVLFQLELIQDHKIRMNELADRVLLSRAGITRLVDRLVADGLVSRLKCASDARGAYAVLTPRGRARLEAARPGHMAAVRRYFLASFTRPELATLAELLGRSALSD
jgi:DNA-binding MarR family transcriptional regulator